MTPAWWGLCLLHLLPGAAGLIYPLWFAEQVAGVATDTAHFARDVGVAELTLAVAAGLAALRPSARLPVMVILATHVVLHAVSHVIDRSSASGEANAAVAGSLVLQALLLAVAARGSTLRRRPDAVPAGPTPPRGRRTRWR